MEDIPMKTNPLVRSVIHQPFQQAINHLGLPAFPRAMFTQDIGEYLNDAGSLFDDDPKTVRKLWQAVLRGDVLLTEVDGEQLLFYVRASVGARVMDIRLICETHNWRVDSVVSMHRKSVVKSSGFTGSTLVLAVIVAGIIGYEAHGPLGKTLAPVFRHTQTALLSNSASINANTLGAGNSNASSAANTAPSQTSADSTPANTAAGISITSTNVTSPGGNAESSISTSNPSSSTANVSSGNTVSTSSDASAKTVTFTLKPGMPLHTLSAFLAQQGIIVESAATFDHDLTVAGIDRTIRPGTYTFHTGMTKQQIFSVLNHGK